MTCIYVLIDPATNEPRYVGKTIDQKRRLKEHIRANGKTRRDCWIRSIRPLAPVMVCLEESEDWHEAEVFWVSYLRSLGARLVNHTDGGAGVAGYKPTTEARAKIGAASKMFHSDPARKERRLAALRETTSQPEYKKTLSVKMKAVLSGPAVRAKMSEAAKTNQRTEEARRKRSVISKAIWQMPGMKERASKDRSEKQQQSVYREKMSTAVKAAFANPDVRERHKAAMNRAETRERLSKAAQSRPPISAEALLKRGEAIKAAMSTPEYRAKRSQIAKEIHAKRRLNATP